MKYRTCISEDFSDAQTPKRTDGRMDDLET